MQQMLEKFIATFPVKRYKKGTVILHQDVRPPAVLVVRKGIVKCYNLTAHGEEKPIMFVLPGHLFPTGWVYGKLRSAQYFYEAFSDCSVSHVSPEVYLQFLRQDTDVLLQFLGQLVDNELGYQLRINALTQSKAPQKILHTIHYLALHFGRDVKSDVVEIPLPFTQQDLANITGLTRETTGAELKKLTTQGVLQQHGLRYIVHTDKLNTLLDDEYEHRLARSPNPGQIASAGDFS